MATEGDAPRLLTAGYLDSLRFLVGTRNALSPGDAMLLIDHIAAQEARIAALKAQVDLWDQRATDREWEGE